MFHPCVKRRRGFSLVELLVVIAIIGILAGLMMGAVHRALEVARRTECANNLKNLGLALYYYQDARGAFPCEAESGESFYINLLDSVEQGHQLDPVRKGGQNAAEPVRVFLCPGRRTIHVGAKGDYGFGSNPGNGLSSILGSAVPVSITAVTNADGASNTLLLSHKGVKLMYYDGSGPNDTGWATLDHSRDPNEILRDSNQSDMSTRIGSPHANVAPSLFADGSVRNVSYDLNSVKIGGLPAMALLWAYNDGKGLGKHAP